MPDGHRAAELRQRGDALFASARYEEAAAAYAESSAAAPQDMAPLVKGSASLLAVGDLKGAVWLARRALRLSDRLRQPTTHPMRTEAMYSLAAAMMRSLHEASPEAGAREARARRVPEHEVVVILSAMAAVASVAHLSWENSRPPLDAKYESLLTQACAISTARGTPGDWARLISTLERGGETEAFLPLEDTADVAHRFENVDSSLLAGQLREKLECPLCVELLYQPSALPCGHVLCRSCIARLLDQIFDMPAQCPLCRYHLGPYLSYINRRAFDAGNLSHGAKEIAVCVELARLIEKHLSTEYCERMVQVAAGEAAAGHGNDESLVPVFICNVAVPGVKCPIHVFEPRYRLMMRRCIDSGRREFGMAINHGASYGTMLYIRHFEQLQDGRSRLDTVGTRRFRVLEWGMKDGYSTARVAWIVDDVEPDPAAAPSPAERITATQLRTQLEDIVSGLPLLTRDQLLVKLGEVPQDDALLPFWCTALLSQGDPRLMHHMAFSDATRTSPTERMRIASELLSRFLETGEADEMDDVDEEENDA
mmetsp:Transcript_22398/g.51255  ORF Transcript_22398/g.51255 Transcript_22398/m.51255 type:complete len:539 (+) Transcript_22398:3-1619(+)